MESSTLERALRLGSRISSLLDRAAKLDLLLEENSAAAKRMKMESAPSTPVQIPVQSLRLCVKTGADEITFKVLSTTKFVKLFDAYAERRSVDWKDYIFISTEDGTELMPDSSAQEHTFKDMQMIECRLRQ